MACKYNDQHLRLEENYNSYEGIVMYKSQLYS